jgi:hypothetical protein
VVGGFAVLLVVAGVAAWIFMRGSESGAACGRHGRRAVSPCPRQLGTSG